MGRTAEASSSVHRVIANPETIKRDSKRDLRRARRRDERRAIQRGRDPMPRHTKGWAD